MKGAIIPRTTYVVSFYDGGNDPRFGALGLREIQDLMEATPCPPEHNLKLQVLPCPKLT